MKLSRNKIRKLHKQQNQSLKRIKYGNKPKHHKKHNNTFRQKTKVDHSDGNKEITRLSHLFNKTLKSYIPAKELARINKKYKENRYQRRIRKMMRKMIPDGKRTGIMTGGASIPLPLPSGWEVLFDPQGQPFYGNPYMRITQWEYPGELPPGWEVLFDANRRPYYGNPTLNITQYEFPSPATTRQPPAPTAQSPDSPLPKKDEIEEVDAKDSLGNWYKGYIIKRFKFDVVPAVPEMLKVHFIGWGIDTDEYIPVAKKEERIKPRTPDAKTGQLMAAQKDDTIGGVVALYTENHMTSAKEKAEAEARKFKQEEANKQQNQPTQTPEASAPPLDDDNDNKDNKDDQSEEAAAAGTKPPGKCSDVIKTPYEQTINLHLAADKEGALSLTVDPVSTGMDGLPGILNNGQDPAKPDAIQQPPVVASAPPQDILTATAAVGGARRTRRKKYAKRGNKRKMTRVRSK